MAAVENGTVGSDEALTSVDVVDRSGFRTVTLAYHEVTPSILTRSPPRNLEGHNTVILHLLTTRGQESW